MAAVKRSGRAARRGFSSRRNYLGGRVQFKKRAEVAVAVAVEVAANPAAIVARHHPPGGQ